MHIIRKEEKTYSFKRALNFFEYTFKMNLMLIYILSNIFYKLLKNMTSYTHFITLANMRFENKLRQNMSITDNIDWWAESR